MMVFCTRLLLRDNVARPFSATEILQKFLCGLARTDIVLLECSTTNVYTLSLHSRQHHTEDHSTFDMNRIEPFITLYACPHRSLGTNRLERPPSFSASPPHMTRSHHHCVSAAVPVIIHIRHTKSKSESLPSSTLTLLDPPRRTCKHNRLTQTIPKSHTQ